MTSSLAIAILAESPAYRALEMRRRMVAVVISMTIPKNSLTPGTAAKTSAAADWTSRALGAALPSGLAPKEYGGNHRPP